jgi:hypothetical protein
MIELLKKIIGQFVSFGLANGHISFRRNYTWRTSMPPVRGADGEIVRIVYSTDGLNLACYVSDYYTSDFYKTTELVNSVEKLEIRVVRC